MAKNVNVDKKKQAKDWAERKLEGIRKTTEKKSSFQRQRTFERIMAKTKKSRPIYINGNIMWGSFK